MYYLILGMFIGVVLGNFGPKLVSYYKQKRGGYVLAKYIPLYESVASFDFNPENNVYRLTMRKETPFIWLGYSFVLSKGAREDTESETLEDIKAGSIHDEMIRLVLHGKARWIKLENLVGADWIEVEPKYPSFSNILE